MSASVLPDDSVGATAVLGISHIALTVNDLPAAMTFWSAVMGFEKAAETPQYCLLLERSSGIGVAVAQHDDGDGMSFDHRRVGLDHLAFAVDDLAALVAWAERLDRHGVGHSGVVNSDAGHHLNLAAPDGVPIELFVMSAEAAVGFGLSGPRSAVASGHGAMA
jgi:catechol 2,3-dioxygenase-like lactoylglutathione lyase family enzyme